MLHLTRDRPVPSVWFQTFSASVAQAMLCCLQLISILLAQQKCAGPGWIFTCVELSIHNWTSYFTTSFKKSLLKIWPARIFGARRKKKLPKHTMVLQWGQSSPWTNAPQVVGVWLGWSSPNVSFGKGEVWWRRVFSEKVGPLYLVFWGAKSHVFRRLLWSGVCWWSLF